MKNTKEQLFANIWKIADELRGKVDGWDFKNYVLGFLFYRYISENITSMINHDVRNAINHPDPNFEYEDIDDSNVKESIINKYIDKKGFFIKPSELFNNLYKQVMKNNYDDLNVRISEIFKNIEASASGKPSESNIKGLFSEIDLSKNFLGDNVINRNKNLANLIKRIKEFDFFNTENDVDIFGDAYEYLMGMYASNAGKSGGEYYTPQEVSKLLAKLAINQRTKIYNVYDPACGSGSLLLQPHKILKNDDIHFYGQDSNPTTYNLCRINMFLHNINFAKFHITCGDTLIEPNIEKNTLFDVIVSNPPYSVKWDGKSNPTLINDERYKNAGILAPESKADFAFVLNCLYYLKETGIAAIVCFPGIFYRGGAEQKIRQYLIDNNYVSAIIDLPKDLFFGTSIATTILVLSKSSVDKKVLFIDASEQVTKETARSYLSDENIESILEIYYNRSDKEYFSKLVDIKTIQDNNYNLSVSKYVPKPIVQDIVDIKALNQEIDTLSNKNNELRNQIKNIIKEIDNE